VGHIFHARISGVPDHPILFAYADRFDVYEGMDKNSSGFLQAMASSSKGRRFTLSQQKQQPTHSFSASTEHLDTAHTFVTISLVCQIHGNSRRGIETRFCD
jgi:hypothetical protein